MKKVSLLALVFSMLMLTGITQTLTAQEKQLTFEQANYFRGERLTGSLPSIKGWLDDDHYLQEKTIEGNRILYKVNAETGKEEVHIDYSAIASELPEGININRSAYKSKDLQKFLFDKKGSLFYLNTEDQTFLDLVDGDGAEKNPTLSPDGNFAAYTRDNNLYYYDIEGEEEFQLTFDGSDVIKNGKASWVYYEEILGRSSRYSAYWWSPISNKIAFLRFDDSPVPKFPLYIADGVHGELEWEHYPKPGDPNPIVKLGIADLKTKKITWVKFDETKDQYVAWPFWTPDGKELLFQWMNRDQNEIIIHAANPETGDLRNVYSESQPTWVEFFEDIDFAKDGKSFFIQSDKEGYKQLYHYGLDGELINKVTKDEKSISSVYRYDEENGYVYYLAQGDNTVERHLYKAEINGDDIEQITNAEGTHSSHVSPTGKYFVDTYSNINSPKVMNLLDEDGDIVKELGNAKSKVFDNYKLGKAELFTIPSTDGFNLPAKWILPPDFDESKKYPVLFQIYGGPGTQDVRNSFPWSMGSYYLAQNGIIVISVDHRGSWNFGKKGMNYLHRQLGKWEMHDYIEAVKYLRTLPYIDETKIAMNGGSYGGYATAMALSYASDYFQFGVAEYSVTDWKLYDNVYTERYMDLPKENIDGYKFGSVMTHADNYKGGMLITHGTMDDNVHMQNTMQLISILEDKNKDFELMLYPNARHGVGFPKYFHAAKQKAKFYFKHLLNKELETE